jgi:hypothetical protein
MTLCTYIPDLLPNYDTMIGKLNIVNYGDIEFGGAHNLIYVLDVKFLSQY